MSIDSKKVDQSSVASQLASKAGNEVVKKSQTVFELIQSMEKEFKRALPEHVGVERFVRIAITVIRTNPKLMACEGMSIVAALMQSAQLGLEPNTPTKEAYLIPYSNSRMINGKWEKVSEASFQMGYRGIMKLVWQSGLVSEIDCDMICEKDEVIYEKGREGTFKHIPNLKEDRGKPYAFYAYARTKMGGFVCTVWSKTQIMEHAKKFSKSYDKKLGTFSGPWKDDEDSMCLKTVLIDMCDKKLPKSTEYQKLNQQISQDNTIKREVDSSDMTEVIDVTDWSDAPEVEETEESKLEKELEGFEVK